MRLLLWPGTLDRRLVQTSLLVHLPAAVQIQQGGPLQKGSRKRWGGNTAWGAHSPGRLASQQEQPRWHPNILASPGAEKKWIFVPGGHLPGSDLRQCDFVINLHKTVSLSVSLLLLSHSLLLLNPSHLFPQPWGAAESIWALRENSKRVILGASWLKAILGVIPFLSVLSSVE